MPDETDAAILKLLPLPRVPERHAIVENARTELAAFLLEWAGKHDLSSAEYLHLLSARLSVFTHSLVHKEWADEC